MAKLLIKKPIDTLSLEEANSYLPEPKKRIDHARGALLKMVEAGEARVSTAKPKVKKEPKPVLNHDWKESMYEGRQVYVGASTGIILRQAKTEGVEYFEVKMRSGQVKAAKSSSIRWKAVNDKYREQYVHEDEIRTASGAKAVHSGDSLANALLGTGLQDLAKIANENSLGESFDKWVEAGRNAGMVRMNLSNMLRAKIKRGEVVTIFGEDDLEKAAIAARERYAEAMDKIREAKARQAEEREAAKAEAKAKPETKAKAKKKG